MIESGAVERIFEPVYRVAKRGKLDRDAFISTYEEIISRQIPDDDVKLSDGTLWEKQTAL